MHVLSARVRGLPPFVREVSIDLAPLTGLVALVGNVGQGKSTFLDIITCLVLYRRFSTRNSALKDRASARDCEIDVTMAHAGHTWRMLIQVDPQFSGGRGKEEAYLWRDGEALNTGKVTDYDDLIQGPVGVDKQRRGGFFPPESVFFSSAFAIQQTRAGKGSAGFFGMSVPERKQLFAYLIGLERMQELARRAADHRKQLDAKIGDVERELATEAAKVADLDRLRAELPALRFAADAAADAETRARDAVTVAQGVLAGARAVLSQLDEARTAVLGQRARFTAAVASAEAKRGPLLVLIANAERDVLDLDAARTRAVELATATAAKDTASADWTRANGEVRTLAARMAELTADRDRVAADIARQQNAADGLDAARAALLDAQARVESLAGAGERAATLEVELRAEEARVGKVSAEANAESVAATRALDTARRDHEAAVKAAGLLDGVPCEARTLYETNEAMDAIGAPAYCGTCQFLTSARVAADSVPALADALTAAQERERLAADAVARVATERAAVEALRARVDLARKAAADLSRAQTAEATARGDVDRASGAADAIAALRVRADEIATAHAEATARHEKAVADLASVTRRGTEARANVDALAGADVRLRDIEAASVALPGYRRELAQLDAVIADAQASLAELVVPPEPEAAQASVSRAEAGYSAADLGAAEARAQHQAATKALAQTEGAIAQLGDVSAKVATLNARRAALAERRAGFARVEEGFGVNGIQALEIDAAGPEVSTITNELLEACFGSRFAVALRTVQEAKGARVQREVFDLLVYDGESGGSRPLDEMSGGEQALIDEALRLAIAIFNSRRHGAVFSTLYRDECDGQFHEAMAARYPAMLRRAMVLGSFDRIFMISHRAIVADQSDAQILVGDGRVTIA